MDPRVLSEFNEAKEKFPDLIQIDRGFSIRFPGCQPFKILISGDYPLSAPKLFCGDSPVTTELTRNWMSYFRLEHVVRQLQVYSQAPDPGKLSVPVELKKKIENASPADVATEAQWRTLFSECQPFVDTRDRIKRSEATIKATTEQIEEMRRATAPKRDELFTLCQDFYGQKQQRLASGKREMIDGMKGESASIERGIPDLIAQFNGSGADVFAGNLMKERKRAIELKLKAEILTQRG